MAKQGDGGGSTREKIVDAAVDAARSAAERAQNVAGGTPHRSMVGMNVVMFITDQDRAIQHFPPGWAKRNLHGATRLARQGVSFNNAFTNSCMCSPAWDDWQAGQPRGPYLPPPNHMGLVDANGGGASRLLSDFTDPRDISSEPCW